MKFRKFLFIMLIAAGMSIVFAGCGSSEGETEGSASEDGVIELDFWTFWGSEPRRDFIETIVEEFNNSQDEIHVTHTFLPWGDIWTKNLASVAAGNPADVIINDINSVAQRAEKQQNTNLSEFIAEEPGFEDQYFPHLWDAVLYEGEAYAVPFVTDTRILYYNKDIMEEAGLDPEKPPVTWDELKEMGLKMDVKDGDRFTTIGYLPRYGISGDVYYMNATGHGFWDYEEGKPIVNDPLGIEILEWLVDYEKHYGLDVINAFEAEFGNQQADPFLSGKLGMMVKEATHYTNIKEFAPDLNFGVAPLPKFSEQGGNTSWGGGFVVEIPYGAEHPEASWEFIKYLTGPEAQEYWAIKNFDNVAHIEAGKKAINNEELTETDKMVYELAVENLENTILTPNPLEAPDMLSVIEPELDRIYLGEKTPQEALDDAQEAVERLAESAQ